MKATWNGTVIADSNDTVVAEGNHYLPSSALDRNNVQFGNHKTSCAWKGQASYYSLIVNGDVNTDAVWYYADRKRIECFAANFQPGFKRQYRPDDLSIQHYGMRGAF